MKTQEKNEVIAEFMDVYSYEDDMGKVWRLSHAYGAERRYLSYHSNWNDLVPVLKRIMAIKEKIWDYNPTENQITMFSGRWYSIEQELCKLNVKGVFENAYKFIRDYNNSRFSK